MTFRRFATAVLAVLLCLSSGSATAGHSLVQAPLPEDPMGVHIYRLDNGLTVYLTRYAEEPRFYAEIGVRAGSKHDPAESTGLAHYLEHLLFKGTRNLGTLNWEAEREHIDQISELYQQHFHETDPEARTAIYAKINEASLKAAQYAVPNELDRLYQSMGGDAVNAHTWHEETVYKVDLPANRLAQWAAIESERFVNPVFRLFQTELETVYEEMNRALDNKQRIISYAVDRVLYKTHPYGQQPTLGTVEHLKNPSLKNIGAYFDTYYVPNNMAIFISGDIDVAGAIQTIDTAFSGWQPRELPSPASWAEAPLQGRESVTVTYQGEEFALLAFRTAAQSHADAEPLQLLDMILDNATAGLININLNQKQRVRQAGSSPQQYNDYGAQYLWGIPNDGQTLEEVEQLLLEQIEIVKRGEFEDWLLPAIINDYKKREKASLESNTARVSFMRDAWIGFEEWEHAIAKIRRMEKITKEDIVRVANKYFGSDYVAGYRKDAPHELPKIQKPSLAAIDIDPTRESEFAKKIAAMPVVPIEPVFVDPATDYTVERRPNGVEFYHVKNAINDLFNFSITVDFGTHQDNTIGVATQLLDKAGTGSRSPEELRKAWYQLATDFGIGAGDNESSITLNGLDENFEASIKLLMELITTATAEDATLEKLKEIILIQREDGKKQADTLASALVQYNRHGADSSFLRLLPSTSVKALTTAQLLGVIRDLLGYKFIVSYTGSLPADAVRSILDRHLPMDAALKDPPPYRFLTARAPESTEVYFFDKEAAQARIRLEFGTMEYTASLAPQISLYNEYFSGGMSGIVFQELREARALAYSAGARYLEGYRLKDQDLMIGAIQSQADKTPEAVEAFLDLLDKLPASEERFAAARASLINQYRTGKIGFRGIIGAVRGWERRGLAPDPRRERFEAIQKSSLSDVLEFHKAHLAGRPKLISIVGEKSKIDMERIGKLGPVRELSLSEIFVD